MSNEVLFGTQIASIVVFVASLFVLYRLLVQQKDSTIENLREQRTGLEAKVRELEQQTPDALATVLAKRINISLEEIERLREDKDMDEEAITAKEADLQHVQTQLEEMTAMLREADLVCPHCEAILETRQFYPIFDEFNGRTVEVDIEVRQYECGLEVRDGKEVAPCRFRRDPPTLSDS